MHAWERMAVSLRCVHAARARQIRNSAPSASPPVAFCPPFSLSLQFTPLSRGPFALSFPGGDDCPSGAALHRSPATSTHQKGGARIICASFIFRQGLQCLIPRVGCEACSSN